MVPTGAVPIRSPPLQRDHVVPGHQSELPGGAASRSCQPGCQPGCPSELPVGAASRGRHTGPCTAAAAAATARRNCRPQLTIRRSTGPAATARRSTAPARRHRRLPRARRCRPPAALRTCRLPCAAGFPRGGAWLQPPRRRPLACAGLRSPPLCAPMPACTCSIFFPLVCCSFVVR